MSSCIGVLIFFSGYVLSVVEDSGLSHRGGHSTAKYVETKSDCNGNYNFQESKSIDERINRQEIFFGVCSQEEYIEWYYSQYPENCRYLMENLQFEQQRYLVYCDEECGEPYLNFLKSCEDSEQSAQYYKDLCYENSNGVQCAYYFLAQEKLQPAYYVENNCDMAFGNGNNCSFDCFIALHQFKNQLGCCVNNIYNHSSVYQVADFQLWSKCGVDTPGRCSGGKVLISSSLVTTVLVILALM